MSVSEKERIATEYMTMELKELISLIDVIKEEISDKELKKVEPTIKRIKYGFWLPIHHKILENPNPYMTVKMKRLEFCIGNKWWKLQDLFEETQKRETECRKIIKEHYLNTGISYDDN